MSYLSSLCIYVVVHVLTYFLVINVLSKAHVKNQKSAMVKDPKYEPFSRIDIDKWGLFKNFPAIMTFWPRCISCILNIAVYAIWLQICMIGVSIENPKIGPTR